MFKFRQSRPLGCGCLRMTAAFLWKNVSEAGKLPLQRNLIINDCLITDSELRHLTPLTFD